MKQMTVESTDVAKEPRVMAAFWTSSRRWLPLAVLAAGAVAFFALGLHRYFSLDSLRANRGFLTDFVAANATAAAGAFMLAYAVGVVFVPPSGTLMTVIGGFLFGVAAGTAYVVVGATLGATVLFLAARMAFADALRARAGNAVARMEAGFRENELSYMFVLRLVPLFPFWLVNIAPAFLGVSLRTYVIGTFFGIIPGAAVYAVFGAGLGSVLDDGGELTLAGVLTPEIVAAMVGLALLALVPVGYKRLRRKAE